MSPLWRGALGSVRNRPCIAWQKLARVGMDLLGPWAPLRAGSPEAKLDGEIAHAYLTSLGHTIAGGTAEILRTTVATRGLGLPSIKGPS